MTTTLEPFEARLARRGELREALHALLPPDGAAMLEELERLHLQDLNEEWDWAEHRAAEIEAAAAAMGTALRVLDPAHAQLALRTT